jgi:integrase
VPLHPSTVKALGQYRWQRDVAGASRDDDAPFFIGTRGRLFGKPMGDRHQVHRVFATLRNELGWPNRGTHHAPRIHDLRHTFVVRRILLWQQQGIDVDEAMLSLSTYVGHAMVTNTYWYLQAVPELMAVAAALRVVHAGAQPCVKPRQPKGLAAVFPALVQQFFTEYLVAQRAVSPRTVACYRDAMTLVPRVCASQQAGQAANRPCNLPDITPELILKFLAHLEHERHNSVRSRNLRLTALRAFLKFAGRRDVTALHAVERAMAVPMKRFERPLLGT